MTFNEEKQEMIRTAEKFRDSAFPVTIELQYETKNDVFYRATSKGLSKREYFAVLMAQGLFSCADLALNKDEKAIAKMAVIQADALIEALK